MPYRNSVEVLLQPLLALAALQSCDCQVHQATLERHLQCPLCKAEDTVLGGFAGLLGQPVQLPGQSLPTQRPANTVKSIRYVHTGANVSSDSGA